MPWIVAAEPELRVGVADGASAYQFFRISAVRHLPNGHLVVGNAATGELRLYDADGTYTNTGGGAGEGPGEFRGLDHVSIVNDSIFASDHQLIRVNVFTSRGVFARSFSLAGVGAGALPRLLGSFGDGTFLVEDNLPFWTGDPEPGIQSLRSSYYRVDGGGATIAKLGEFEAGQHLLQPGERGISSTRLPFGRVSFAAAVTGGFYFGTGEHAELRQFSAAGKLIRIIRHDTVLPSVETADLETYIDALVAVIQDPGARQRLESTYRDSPLPPTRPAYTQVRVGAAGDLWAEHFRIIGDSASEWTIFDTNGKYLGVLALPNGFTPHEIGEDFILGVRVDEQGVEFVERYRVQRMPPESGQQDR
jgi:hypothetical protein